MDGILIWMATLGSKCLSLIDEDSDYGRILIWMATLESKYLSLIYEDSDHWGYIDMAGDSSV
jgi:hypothetical protein